MGAKPPKRLLHGQILTQRARAGLWIVVALAVVAAAAVGWRAIGAAWFDDFGNVFLLHGDLGSALRLFDRGIALEPRSSVLLEDRGRAELSTDPAAALRDFRAADCGSPCMAGEGEALDRLGKRRGAEQLLVRAKAIADVARRVDALTRQGRFDEALTLERALAAQFSHDAVDQADLATTDWQIGQLEATISGERPERAAAYRKDAIAMYGRASSLAPYNESYLLSLGFAELDWGDRAAAKRVFLRLLELHPHQSDAERALKRLDSDSPDSGPTMQGFDRRSMTSASARRPCKGLTE